jgi:hypothetical protein
MPDRYPDTYLPAWSMDNVTWNPFPGYYRLGGSPFDQEEENIKIVTDSGVRFVYNLFTRDSYELVFRVTYSYLFNASDDLDVTTLFGFHNTVQGEGIPFYFSAIGDGSDSEYVRKEAGFHAVELDTFGDIGSGPETVYDYTLRMTQELT